MSKKSKGQRLAEQLEAEQKAKLWRQRIRRLAIERLRWIDVNAGDMPADEKDQRLHELELAQRQVKADLWRSIPDCKRWEGTGKNKRKLDKDADRWKALWKLVGGSENLVLSVLDRRHGPQPTFDPGRSDKACYGPFDIQLDDLDGLLDDDIHVTIQKLSAGHERMNKPVTLRPDGSIAAGPAQTPAAPRTPISPSSRPTPPPIPPMKLEDAEDFSIPFGKYQGDTIGFLLGNPEGVSYLRWLCTKAEIKSDKFREALQVVYDYYEGEIESGKPPQDVVARVATPRPAPPPPIHEDDIPF